MPIYNKLVREESTNKKYSMKTLDSSDHEVEIKLKLIDELKEYQEASSNEEVLPEIYRF